MSDLEAFESPRILMGSAEKCICDFESGCVDFVQSCTYDVISHTDPKTGEKVFKMRFKQRMPNQLRVHAHRILTDLRHALDHAMGDGAIALGRSDGKGVYFPFAGSANELGGEIKRHCRNVHTGLINFVTALKPYYGGDDTLYAMSRLAGASKHQRIIRVSLNAQGLLIVGSKLRLIQGPVKFGPMKWNELRNELEIARVGLGGQFDADLTPLIQIVLGTGEPPFSGEAVPAFRTLLCKVESIISGIEAETSRLRSNS